MDNESITKFKEYIAKREKDTKSKLGNDKKSFGVYAELEKTIEEKDIEKLVSLKKYIPLFEEKITDYEKAVKYLIDNDLVNTPQYRKIEEILFGEEIKEHIKQLQEETKEEIENKKQLLGEYKKLGDGDFSNSFLYDILSNGAFTEQEELDILMYYISITCEEKTEEEKEEVVEEAKEVRVNIDEVKEEYEKIRAIAHDVLDKVSYEFREIDQEFKSFIKSYLRVLDSESDKPDEKTIVVRNFTYADIKRMACLFDIESSVKHVESVLYGEESVDEEEVELLRMIIADIKDNIKITIEASNELKKEEKEENNPEPSNVSVLLDDEDKPFVNEKVTTEESQSVRKLIEKLEQGIYDADKGIKHRVLKCPYDKNTVFINKYGNVGCSYIRVDNNRVIVLNIDTFKNIFKSAIALVDREEDRIEEYKELVLENNTDFISKQNDQIYMLKGAHTNER